jgi:L-ornithine N5-oxygenase
VGRDYRLQLPAHVRAPIFAQGFSEATHGLSDTLLSVMAVRAGEIARSLTSLLSTTATRRAQADEEVAL